MGILTISYSGLFFIFLNVSLLFLLINFSKTIFNVIKSLYLSSFPLATSKIFFLFLSKRSNIILNSSILKHVEK